MNRVDFPYSVYMRLRERAAYICSNPDCRRLTVRPHSDPEKSVVVGEACHIHAASVNGPRYDSGQTPEQRASIENAIWLCSACADAIDKDVKKYPAELLKEWKSNHDKWVAEGAMIPKLPVMQITDSPGISLPVNHPSQITSEDCSRFRERQLLVENPNRVPLFNLSFRMQLPETIAAIVRSEIPPGINVHFQPETIPMTAFAQGEGASVTTLRPQRPTTNWTLQLDYLPARMATRINVLTTVDWMHESDEELSPTTSQDPEVLCYYIEGHLFFDCRSERTRMQVVVPIQFNRQSRTLESLLPQPDFAPYKSVSRTQRFG